MDDEELKRIFSSELSSSNEETNASHADSKNEAISEEDSLSSNLSNSDFVETKVKTTDSKVSHESNKQYKGLLPQIIESISKLNSFKSNFSSRVNFDSKKEYLPNFPLSFKGTLVAILGVSIIMLVLGFFLLPSFRVQIIEINGNQVISDEKICEMAGIQYGSHLMSGISGDIIDYFRLDYGKTEDKIKNENAYVEDIRITISFPSTIKIDVVERSKIAYIEIPDGYVSVDLNGVVVEFNSFDGLEDIHPLVCGMDVSSVEISQPIQVVNTTDYNKSLVVLGAVLAADINGGDTEYSMFENLLEVRVVPGGNIFLTFVLPNGATLQVKLEAIDNINDDMNWLLYSITENAFDNLPDGALDMTGEEYVYREYQ